MLRKAAVAGSFYPGNPQELNGYLDEVLRAAPQKPLINLKGLIVPHAGYIYSAPVAAHAYNLFLQLPENKYNVFIISPAHYVATGASIGLFEAFETPLGQVKVNQKICREILAANAAFDTDLGPHLPEHSLEVQLPFLQKTLKNFQIIPILLGQADPQKVATAVAPYFQADDSLFVFSSDLSHYHPYVEAKNLDGATLEILLGLNLPMSPQMEACGDTGLTVAMELAKRNNYQIELLDYRNSGDTAGDKKSVVGYAACAITKSTK